MANKQDIKKSEARILILISQVDERLRYTGAIAAKLDMDYSYTIHILEGMVTKKWIKRLTSGAKTFYEVNKASPMEAAKELL